MRILRTLLIALLALHAAAAAADTTTIPASGTARRVIRAASLPATCSVSDVYFKTAATVGPYFCLTANNWSAATIGGYAPGGTDVAVADGGTGLSTLAANNVILGNGSAAPLFVAPGTSGNLLTSNGTTWTSAAPSGGLTGPGTSTANGIATWTDTSGTSLSDNTVALESGAFSNLTNGNVAIGFMSISSANSNGIAFPTAGVAFKNAAVGATLTLNLAGLTAPRIATWPDGAGTVAYTSSNVATATNIAANQGTTTTVMHGNAAGDPSFGSVSISDVTSSTGTGAFMFATAPQPTNVNITDSALSFDGAQLQLLALQFANNGGTLQHRIFGDPNVPTASAYAGKITGASATYANTPTLSGVVDFTSGVGVNSEQATLNTAAQTVSKFGGFCHVEFNSTATAGLTSVLSSGSFDVNGVTRTRPTISLFTSAGAAHNINTTNIGSGTIIRIRCIMLIQ